METALDAAGYPVKDETAPAEAAPKAPETLPAKPAEATRGAKVAQDVQNLLRARNALLWVVTREEVRAERAVAGAAVAAGYDVRYWDCATGVTDGDYDDVDADAKDPAKALEMLDDAKARQVWVLRDMHSWLRDPTVLRKVRTLARELAATPRASARAMVILTPSNEVPPELMGSAVVVDWPLPDRAEIASILAGVVRTLPDNVEKPDAATTDAAVDAAVGLSADEAASCYAKSLVTSRKICPAVVASEKKRVVAREKVLEWYDPDPRGLEAVGGLDNLKSWLATRRQAFSQRARAFGLPVPKGVLLVGVPGCGKSLTAKAVSSAYGMPLLRMDVGALRSKWVGESEGNLRKALATAEAVAPCILWLDEVEKALAGATQGAADGGVSADALGTILSWMQEKTAPVFIVATANDVRSLPPEVLRKGRFDEVFWVDLPTRAERVEVLAAALRGAGRDAAAVDVDAVVDETVDFTGAEIAALVPEALFAAFADGERQITTEDLTTAAGSVVPLAKTAADRIAALREWAKTRARPASKTSGTKISVTDASKGGLDL
jgi:hypothetical protein